MLHCQKRTYPHCRGRCFSRRGYTKATLDEIIALADTGKGTLYKYFGNKDNLFYTLIEEKHNHLMDELHSLTAQQPDIRGKLQAYLNCMLKFLRTNKGLWLIVWYELNAAHQGIHPDFDENGNWILTSFTATRCPGRRKNAFCATTKFCGRKFTYWQQFYRTGRKAAI